MLLCVCEDVCGLNIGVVRIYFHWILSRITVELETYSK